MEPTALHGVRRLYAMTTEEKNFVAEVYVPKFVTGDPDVIIWGQRFFKRSGAVDDRQEWKYLECFVYVAPGVV